MLRNILCLFQLRYGGLNENSLVKILFAYLLPSGWNRLEMIRRYDLVEEYVSLETVFEDSKVYAIPR